MGGIFMKCPIYGNELRRNGENQLKAYYHEMLHIENSDYRKSCTADIIECYAHALK